MKTYSNGKPRPDQEMKQLLTRPTDEMRLHLTLPRPIWKELSLIAIAQDKSIKRVAVECIQKHLDSTPPEERPKSMFSVHPARSGPVLRGTYALAEKKPLAAVKPEEIQGFGIESIRIEECEPIPSPESVLPPEPKKPTWSEIWRRLKDHLYEQEPWDELQTYLKGTTPPNDFLQWKLDRQIAWLEAYVPLEGV